MRKDLIRITRILKKIKSRFVKPTAHDCMLKKEDLVYISKDAAAISCAMEAEGVHVFAKANFSVHADEVYNNIIKNYFQISVGICGECNSLDQGTRISDNLAKHIIDEVWEYCKNGELNDTPNRTTKQKGD